MNSKFPISRDPPEGGTSSNLKSLYKGVLPSFQFLGIPPKGEREFDLRQIDRIFQVSNF